MKVYIKNFDVGSKGIEFEVRSKDDKKQVGDFYLTMTALIWCQGKTAKENGIKVSWEEFIAICASEKSRIAAIKAAKG